MQNLSQDSLSLSESDLVYMEISFSSTPLVGPQRSDFERFFNSTNPTAVLLNVGTKILSTDTILPGQNDLKFLFQVKQDTSAAIFLQSIQQYFQAGIGNNFRVDGYTVEDGEQLESGDPNPFDSSQVVDSLGHGFVMVANDPTKPSFLCKEIGIGCSGGFNFSTTLIVIAIAVVFVSIAYFAKTVKAVLPT
jgi:hypothetical protein